jgi:iron uptake system component EfeO
MSTRRTLVILAASLAIAGCTSNTASKSAANGRQSIKITSDKASCTASTATAKSGTVTFDVQNKSSEVTEFYLLAADGLRIVGEVENIGPGISRNLIVSAAPGEYFTACKPGMKGDGIRSKFTVTQGAATAVDASTADLLKTATDQYGSYVREQIAQLSEKTETFATLYVSGDDAKAREMYPAARTHWERIEPVAESLGDLDPRLDLREADLEPGQDWTGWHRAEKDLWPPKDAPYTALTSAERKKLSDLLVADTKELVERVKTLTFDGAQLGNGAKELLDEVATGKVTGEEEIWSHTDLSDFQANVDGARIAYEVLAPVLKVKDPKLGDTLAQEFKTLQAMLDTHRSGSTFKLYNELSETQIKELANSVSALGEPLSRLTAAVVS